MHLSLIADEARGTYIKTLIKSGIVPKIIKIIGDVKESEELAKEAVEIIRGIMYYRGEEYADYMEANGCSSALFQYATRVRNKDNNRLIQSMLVATTPLFQ